MAATTSLSLSCMASESLFCVRWIRKTIRKVMTVVTVLATSCHVSDQWNIGPVTSQRTIDALARMNAVVDPDQRVPQLANRSNIRPPRDEAVSRRVPSAESTCSKNLDGVFHHLLVRRGDEQIVFERLANQHPIERIAVM